MLLKAIQCWFEFASTYSYLAVHRAEARAASYGLEIEWRPFLLGPIFARLGWNDSPFNLYPRKGEYMWRDMERRCAAQGLPFRKPTRFPRSGLLAARIVCGRMEEGWALPFARAVYRANFVDDREIEDHAVIEDLLRSVGVDPGPLITAAQSPQGKARLRQQTEEAAERGVFGAPTFIVGEEVFWGNDRLLDAILWASRGRTVSSPGQR